MKIKKLCGAFAVAISVFALSTITLADSPYFSCPDTVRENVAEAIATMAVTLRCKDFTVYDDGTVEIGTWPNDDPIWQKKPKKGGDGCEVHFSLSKLLDARDQDKKKNKGQGTPNNGDRRGAARAVRDFQNEYAKELLQGFIDTIDNGIAVLRADHEPFDHSHYLQAADFAQAARDAQTCIDGIDVKLLATKAPAAENSAIEVKSGSGGGSTDLPLLTLLALTLLGRARRFERRS